MSDESLTPVETTSERLRACAREIDNFYQIKGASGAYAHENVAAILRKYFGRAVTMDEGRRIEGWAKERKPTDDDAPESMPIVSHYFAEGEKIIREFDGSEIGEDDDGYVPATLILRAPAPTASSPTEVNEK